MKTQITSTLFCLAYGHNYYRLQESFTNSPEIVCKCCKRFFWYDSHGDIVEAQKKSSFLYSKIKKTV